MRRYVRHSKKRTQASPDQAVGDPTRVQRPVRVADGRDPGPLRRALRSEETRSLLRRETLPALLAEVRESLACKPGKPKRVDFEYERRGMANVLLAFEPLKGRREMRVTEHRRKLEFAAMMRHLLDDLYPEVERIRLVVDNLNTHSPAAFYESFSAQEARRMSKKIEFVYTPKHGSWLNMVEIELSVLVRQCLKRRLPDTQSLEREAGAWCEERNRLGTSVDWRFTTEDARIKLRKLYPSIDT
jgi:transposase